MKNLKFILITLLMLLTSTFSYAQKDSIAQQREARKYVREGNKLYLQKNFTDASVAYKKALEKNSSYKKASYNLGNALYQNKDQNKDKKDGDDKDKKDPKKDGDKGDDKKKQDPKKNDKSKQKPQPGKMSPQQIKQLLESLNNEEKKTQKKLNAKKAKGKKVKQEKDW